MTENPFYKLPIFCIVAKFYGKQPIFRSNKVEKGNPKLEDKPVPESVIQTMLEAAVYAPSASLVAFRSLTVGAVYFTAFLLVAWVAFKRSQIRG